MTSRLQRDGYNVVAPAVPLRGIAADTSYLSGVLGTIPGPKVLVGHSYGGALVSELADTAGVKSLVYVAAFIPEAGETLGALNSQFPGSELGDVTRISYPGGVDLAVKPATAGPVLAADIPAGRRPSSSPRSGRSSHRRSTSRSRSRPRRRSRSTP